MALYGPPPQPTKLKLLNGNPGKRRINHREPQPVGAPEKPGFVTGAAAVEWDRVTRSMPDEFFTSADTPTLAVMSTAWALHRAALAVIAREGTSAVGSQGQDTAHPLLAVVARNAELVLRASDRLGLSPVARTRLDMPEPGGGKFDGLLGRLET